MATAYEIALFLLRVVTGFMVWQHGAQKLFGLPGGAAADLLTPAWAAGRRARHRPRADGVSVLLLWVAEDVWPARRGAEPFLSLQWYAGVIELFGGAAIMAGLLTRPVAFVCSGEMAFAYFINHNPRGFFPIQNGGERAALFCFYFLFLSAAGPGKWSLDARLPRGRRRR